MSQAIADMHTCRPYGDQIYADTSPGSAIGAAFAEQKHVQRLAKLGSNNFEAAHPERFTHQFGHQSCNFLSSVMAKI